MMNVCRLLSVWRLMIFYSCLVIRVTFGFWILLSHAVCAELTFPNTTNSLRSISEPIVCALNKTPDKSLSLQINKHSHTRKVVVKQFTQKWKLIWRMQLCVVYIFVSTIFFQVLNDVFWVFLLALSLQSVEQMQGHVVCLTRLSR